MDCDFAFAGDDVGCCERTKNLNIFEEANRILSPLSTEDRSDWVQEKVPDDRSDGSWGYALHPPAIPKDPCICSCGCSALKLLYLYKDKYPYWCLHCGPQVTARNTW